MNHVFYKHHYDGSQTISFTFENKQFSHKFSDITHKWLCGKAQTIVVDKTYNKWESCDNGTYSTLYILFDYNTLEFYGVSTVNQFDSFKQVF